jgi:hypothetical protein
MDRQPHRIRSPIWRKQDDIKPAGLIAAQRAQMAGLPRKKSI